MLSCMPTESICNGKTTQRVLQPHPWTIKQQNFQWLSMPAVESQQLDNQFNLPFHQCNSYASSSHSSQQYDLFLLDGPQSVNKLTSLEISSNDSSKVDHAIVRIKPAIVLCPFSQNNYESKNSNVISDPMKSKTTLTHYFEAPAKITASTPAAVQYSDPYLQQNLIWSPTTVDIGVDSSSSVNQSAQSGKQVMSPLLADLGLWSPETSTQVQMINDTRPLLNEMGKIMFQQFPVDSQSCRFVSQLPSSVRETKTRRRETSKSIEMMKSYGQRQRREDGQRPRHQGCSTLAYNFKRTGVDKPRKYRCNIEGCDKAYKKSSHLQSHQLTHSDGRPFRCSETECEKAFRRRDELKKHEKTHSDVKPYQCPDCSACFSRTDHVEQHRLRHRNTRCQSIE